MIKIICCRMNKLSCKLTLRKILSIRLYVCLHKMLCLIDFVYIFFTLCNLLLDLFRNWTKQKVRRLVFIASASPYDKNKNIGQHITCQQSIVSVPFDLYMHHLWYTLKLCDKVNGVIKLTVVSHHHNLKKIKKDLTRIWFMHV